MPLHEREVIPDADARTCAERHVPAPGEGLVGVVSILTTGMSPMRSRAISVARARRPAGRRHGEGIEGAILITELPCYDEDPMSSIKKTLMKQGMKLMTDPRVMNLMQDERVMKAVMQMMSVPGKVQTFTNEQVEKLAKAMSLATEDEVKDLKRQIRRLEEEVSRLEKDKK